MTAKGAIEKLCTYASVNGSGLCTQREFDEAKRMGIEALKKEAINEQIMWERNIALSQLEEIGVGLGAKMDVVKEALKKKANLEKVVARLEEEKGIAFLTLANTGDSKYDLVYDNVMAYINKAIEIIKEEVG